MTAEFQMQHEMLRAGASLLFFGTHNTHAVAAKASGTDDEAD